MARISQVATCLAYWLFVLLVNLLLLCLPVVSAQAQSIDIYLPLVQRSPASVIVEGTITPETGGQIAFLNNKGTLTVQAGVVTEPLHVTVETIAPTPPAGYLDVGLAVQITLATMQGQTVTHLPWPARLRIDASGIDAALIAPHTRRLFHRNSAGEWEQLIHQQGGDPNIFDAPVSDFSPFALFGQPTLRQIRGLAAAANGDLYWVNEEDAAIYRRLANGTTQIYHQLQPPVNFLSQKANNLAFDPASGALFFSDHFSLRRIDADGSEVELYHVSESGGIPGGPLGGMTVDARDGALYICDGSVLRIDPQSGQSLGAVMNLGGTRFDAVAADGAGYLYGLAYNYARSYGTFVPDIAEWSDLYVVNLVETPHQVRLVASGFVGARALAVDQSGVVYVANEQANVLSVVSGTPLRVTGRIKVTAPWALTFDPFLQRLWIGSYAQTALVSVPITQRSPAAALGGTISGLAGSVSGQGSAVSVQLERLDPVPAHHALWLGQTSLTLAAIDTVTKRLVYHLPDPFVTSELDSIAQPIGLSGVLEFAAAGGNTVTGGTPIFPEAGNYLDWSSRPQHLGRDEWLIWHGTPTFDGYVRRVESLDGLFPTWDSTQPGGGPWLAYRFSIPGVYNFRLVNASGERTTQTVTVTPEITGQRATRWQVDPAIGGELRTSGVQINIPPGALPGIQAYTITLSIDQAEPTADESLPHGNRYQVFWDPEPTRLNSQVTIRLPYAISQAGTPVGAIFDPILEGFTPILHEVNSNFVTILLPAMEYKPYPDGAPLAASVGTARIATDPTPPSGETPYHALSTVTRDLWWVLGLANAQWESDHFIVRFNEGAVDTQYAYDLIQALESAYQTFGDTLKFTKPNGKIVVRVTSIIPAHIDGFTPRVGTLSHWYAFFNDSLSADQLKATAAHELFHIFQKSNLATGASLWADEWWLEGSAVWAERVAFPEVKLYAEKIRVGCTFMGKGFYRWGAVNDGLNEEEEYGSAAFVLFLEKRHAGDVLSIFHAIRPLTSLQSTIEGVVGDMAKVYEEFALGFWGQNFANASEWDLSLCKSSVYLTDAATQILDLDALPALSSGFRKAYYKPSLTPDPPIGFSEASGSVLRIAKVGDGIKLYLLNGSQPPLTPDSTLSPIPANSDNDGYALTSKLSERTLYQPFNLVYLNVKRNAPSGQTQVVVEAPSITNCSAHPPQQAGEPWGITLQGGGFGPLPGSASLGTVSGWNEGSVGLTFHAPAYGTYTINGTHKNGVTSNSCSFVISN